MKKILVTTLAVMIGLSLFAQETPEQDIKKARQEENKERIKAARVAYLSQRMELTTAESEKFWPVYREYAEKREAIMQRVRQEREGGKDDNSMIQLMQKARQEQLDLEKSYTPRFLQVISAEKLIRMNDAERDFNGIVRRQISKGNRGGGGMKPKQPREKRNR